MLTLEWVAENYADGDHQAVLAAVARGLLPAPLGDGWEAGSIRPSALREAFQNIERGKLTAGNESPSDAMYETLADRLLDDPRLLSRLHGAVQAGPVDFVTIDHVCRHYDKGYSDIQAAVNSGVFPPPVFSDAGAIGWTSTAFGLAENQLREVWGMIPLGPDGPDSDSYPDTADDADEEARDRHAYQLAQLGKQEV